MWVRKFPLVITSMCSVIQIGNVQYAMCHNQHNKCAFNVKCVCSPNHYIVSPGYCSK